MDNLKVIKVIHVTFSGPGSRGGAPAAASRLHLAECRAGVDSIVWCARQPGHDEKSICVKNLVWQKLDSLKNILLKHIFNWIGLDYECSLNIFPSRLVQKLNASDADIVHLHWVNAEMVSIAQLSKISKPVVWTLHDMWAFCGGEHYTDTTRYVEGYRKVKATSLGFDIDRWVYRRKIKHWKEWRPHVVTCSHWLADCARLSQLFRKLDVDVVHNCVDLEVFKPRGDSSSLRRKYGLPLDKRIILFGASRIEDKRKGGDLLLQALQYLPQKEEWAVAVFGTDKTKPSLGGMEAFALGSISKDYELAKIYNLADVMCVPSRQDNLPNTAVEACACGIPIVAYNAGGLSDIVEHKINGFLAIPFDPQDFARGIVWVLEQEASPMKMKAREKAERQFDQITVAQRYIDIYTQLL